MAIDNRVRTYTPGKVIITFGDIIFTGFADGTFVTIERNGDSFTKKKGSDGSVDRINNNAFDFNVSVTLKQTSITNDALSTIHGSDILNNDGIKPLTVQDLQGTSLFYAAEAWINKDPSDEYGDELSDREWVFETGPADKFTGGNNPFTA